MSNHRLVQLEASLDEALNQFQLTQNAKGEYPWQQQQREKRNRRALVVGAGATAAGVGADQIMRRYGGYDGGGVKGAFREAGRDAMRTGQEVAGRAQKAVTDAAGSAVQAGKNLAGKVQKTAKNAVMRGRASWRTTGEMGKPLMQRAGKAVRAGLRAIKLADGNMKRLVHLEAVLDDAIQFQQQPKPMNEAKPAGMRKAKAVAGMVASGAAGYAAGKYGKGLVQRGKAMLKKS